MRRGVKSVHTKRREGGRGVMALLDTKSFRSFSDYGSYTQELTGRVRVGVYLRVEIGTLRIGVILRSHYENGSKEKRLQKFWS